MFRIVFFIMIFGFWAVPAQAGVLEFFFPSLRTDPSTPTQDGKAPFAVQEEMGPGQPKNSLDALKVEAEKRDVSLDSAHLLSADISQWVGDSVSSAMNFESAQAQKMFIVDEKIFTKAGREQYLKFLEEKNIQKVIDTNRYRVSSFVEDTPVLVNEGAVNGVYRWLYRVPVVVSYMDRGMKSYENAKPVTQKAMIDVQIGRAMGAVNDTGVLIERWSGTIKPFKP